MEPLDRPAAEPEGYDEKEAREILERALGLAGRDFTRADLAAMAEELGITPAQLEEAERLWWLHRTEQTQHQTFLVHHRRQLRKALIVYLGLVTLTASLFALQLLTLPGLAFIAALTLVCIGAGLAVASYNAYFNLDGEEMRNDYRKWLRRRERKRLRAEKRRERYGLSA